MSLLSKAWLQAWRTRPNLELLCNIYSEPTDKGIQKRRSDFVNCINTTLQRYREHKNGIDRLKLCSPPSVSPEDFNRWIQIAVENGVKSLDIAAFDIAAPSGSEYFVLAPTVFEAKSIAELDLGHFQLKPQAIKTVRCHNLHKLRLMHVKLDEVLFQRILSSCPLIHWLTIVNCAGLANVKVTKLQKLERLDIVAKGSCSVEVEAPSLLYFKYGKLLSFELERTSRRRKLRMHACPNLKHLLLDEIGITDEFFLDIAEKFPQLEELEITSWDGDLERINISSRSIKHISLESHLEPVEEVQIDVPSLDWFEFTGRSINLFSFTAPSGPCVSKIKLGCRAWPSGPLPVASWFSKLKDMLTKLSQSKVSLHLDIDQPVSRSTAFEVRNRSILLPLPQVQKLSLCFHNRCLDTEDSILDAIFWTCRPKTIAQKWNNCLKPNKIHLAKVIYETFLLGGENIKHTNVQKRKLWQNDLRDVKLVRFKKGQRVHLSNSLDWDTFLEVFPRKGDRRRFRYELEWEPIDVDRKQKVSNPKRRKLEESRK
nr:uncharacterized protein LOC113735403 [Coffea arabica]